MTDHGGYNHEALIRRSQHDELAWETKKIGRARLKHHLRVVADKRLLESLTDAQLDAMNKIRAAYLMRTNGIGYSSMKLLISGGTPDPDYGATLQQDYLLWCGKVILHKLHHAMAMQTIADGTGLSIIDKQRTQRNGTAKANLLACLDLWE